MNHRSLHRTPRINVFALLILGTFLTNCAPSLHYPKIITLGYVNAGFATAGFEISVLDLNNGVRQCVTNSQGIAPSSYSYCETKQQVVYSAPVEDGEELIFEDLTNYRTEALTQGNNHFKLPVWSPNCSMLAFTSFDGDPNVLLLNLENSQTHPAISNKRFLHKMLLGLQIHTFLQVTFLFHLQIISNRSLI